MEDFVKNREAQNWQKGYLKGAAPTLNMLDLPELD
jgi:hypothetical protein